jgi:hypothetical protein
MKSLPQTFKHESAHERAYSIAFKIIRCGQTTRAAEYWLEHKMIDFPQILFLNGFLVSFSLFKFGISARAKESVYCLHDMDGGGRGRRRQLS